MLQITENAASAFREILDREELSGNAIRIAPTRENDGQLGITLLAIDRPGPGDAATQAEGVEVVVAEELAPSLDEAILDVKRSDEGAEFFLRSQGGGGA
jgi:Fe-S cluster assembly iron-binding protein IscA